MRVVGAPQMISQPVSSIFPCSPLPSKTCQNPGLSIPWCWSSHLFSCLPCLLPPSTVPCKMVLSRHEEWETWPYHCSLHLFTIIRKSSCGPIACWILAQTSSLVTWTLYEMVVSFGSTSFLWLVSFGALLWGSIFHKHTGRRMGQGSTSVVSWSREKYSCQSKLVSALSMLLLSVLSWRVHSHPPSSTCFWKGSWQTP